MRVCDGAAKALSTPEVGYLFQTHYPHFDPEFPHTASGIRERNNLSPQAEKQYHCF